MNESRYPEDLRPQIEAAARKVEEGLGEMAALLEEAYECYEAIMDEANALTGAVKP